MSLTGHLDVFPLEEVLRLLARSYKSGCLRVDSPDLHGRIFLTGGSLAFATVGTDDELRRQLLAAQVVNEDTLRTAEVGGRSLAETAGSSIRQLSDFFREEVVESLYRIRKPGRGQFVFNVDVNPRYRSDEAFDVEMCVAEADRRAVEWADIESVLPTIDLNLRVAADAPNGEPVTLAPNTWRLIANFEGTSSVRALSDRLGLSRFRTAKDLTALMRAELVESATPAQPEPTATPAPSWTDYRSDTPAPPVAVDQPVAEVASAGTAYQPADQGAPEPEPAMAKDYNQSWWKEPEAEAPAAEAGDSETGNEPAPAEGDSFLDRVFSQLNETPEGQTSESAVVTHGFLKRRRMSSVGLDE
jgi:hypothetical protein